MQKLKYIELSNMNLIWNENEIKKITRQIDELFSLNLKDEFFTIQGGYNKEQIQLHVCLKNANESMVYPIEIISPLEEESSHIKIQEISKIILDYINQYWSEYFQEQRALYLPIDWQMHVYQDVRIYIRGFIRNILLEQQADILLKEHGLGEYEISPISSES